MYTYSVKNHNLKKIIVKLIKPNYNSGNVQISSLISTPFDAIFKLTF
jgi:hypothetical protein